MPEALDVMLAHTDRAVRGTIDDPVVLAAVTGIERIAAAAGTTDRDRLGVLVAQGARGPLGEIVVQAREQVVSALERRSDGRGPDASTVNVDAGRHAVETDADLVRAAVRAAHATWEAVPYHAQRYGARGARFAASDSSWLVSLVHLAPARAVHQAHWLARVLAARGMPSWLLERHLDDLAAEVATTDPGPTGGPAAVPSRDGSVLRAGAAALRQRRLAALTDEAVHEVAGTLDADLLARAAGQPVVRLVAAAVADTASGLTRDDEPLLGWLTHPERCDDDVAAALGSLREHLHRRARISAPVSPGSAAR